MEPFPYSREVMTGVFGGGKYIVTGNKPALIKMKGKLFDWKGDSFKIVDMNSKDQTPIFSIKGTTFSLRDKRIMYEGDGRTPVFLMEQPIWQWGDKQEIYLVTPEGDKGKALFTVDSNCCDTLQWTRGLTHSQTGQELMFCATMDMWGRNGFIGYGPDLASAIPIAKIHSPLEFANFFGEGIGKEDFILEISPGVCQALVISMVMAYEKQSEDKHRRHQH